MNSMMNKKMVVTNLRVPVEDWNQLKAIAAERGMSANGYINYLMKNVVAVPVRKDKNPRLSILDLPNLVGKTTKKMELSVDDKLIYGE